MMASAVIPEPTMKFGDISRNLRGMHGLKFQDCPGHFATMNKISVLASYWVWILHHIVYRPWQYKG